LGARADEIAGEMGKLSRGVSGSHWQAQDLPAAVQDIEKHGPHLPLGTDLLNVVM
jgi:hypothetical protein